MTPEEMVVEEVKKILNDPAIGIKKEEGKAILALFEHVFLNKQIDPAIKAKWESLGRLVDGKIDLDIDNPVIDIVMMALEWDGLVKRVVVEKEKKDFPAIA